MRTIIIAIALCASAFGQTVSQIPAPPGLTCTGGNCTVPAGNNLVVGTTVVDPVNGVWSPERVGYSRYLLQNYQAAIASLQSSGAGVVSLACLGDSWVSADYICGPLRTSLQATYGNAGVGYISLDATNGAPTGATLASSGTWTDLLRDPSAIGVNVGESTSTDVSTPATKTITATATDVVIHYAVKQNGGSFTYNIDAGGAQTISTDITALNLLRYSDTFGNAAWTNAALTVTSSAATAPDGNPASLLAATITTAQHGIYQNNAVVSGKTYTLSTIAKSNGAQYLSYATAVSGTANAQFDLIAGQAYAPGGYGAAFVSQSMQNLGNGWYLCSLTITASGSGGLYTTLYVETPATYLGASTDQLYAEGMQLNIGPVGAPHVATPVVAAGPLYATWPISGLANSSHSIVLTVTVAGSAGATIMGVEADISTPGVRIHRIGMSGALTSTYSSVTNAWQWQTGIRALNLSLVAIILTVNDRNNNVVPSASVANIQAVVGNIKAVSPLEDILVIAPSDVSIPGSTYTSAQYAQVLQDMARTSGYGFYNAFGLLGPYASENSRGLIASALHLNAAGGRAIANSLGGWLASGQ